jgi:phosphohistidine phosphatase
MKTLLLMRHAKSSWKDPKLADHERPINKRGRRDAPMMGHILVDRELIPQRILSSSALRARQTAEALANASAYPGDVTYLDELYMAEAEGYIDVLRELPNEIERVMVIGHNPGVETLLQILSSRIESLPTAVIAHLILPIERWSDLSLDTTGDLIDIWIPKEMREEIESEEKQKSKEKAKKSKAKNKPQDEEQEHPQDKKHPKDKDRPKDKAKSKKKR